MAPKEVPPLASSNRRILPIWTDGLFALGVGSVAGEAAVVAEAFGWSANFWVAGTVALLLASFCNHVILTVLTGGSIGKLIGGLRVVRVDDLRKPRIGQAIHRWLWGFFYILISPLLMVLDSDIDHLLIAGLRIVRRVNLR
ncbi:RDD family protein [Nonomuraea sp. NPDC004702]